MKAITKVQPPAGLPQMNEIMQQAGQAANEQASRTAFDDHTARKADGLDTPKSNKKAEAVPIRI